MVSFLWSRKWRTSSAGGVLDFSGGERRGVSEE